MSNRDRVLIFPSQGNKVLIKNRAITANKGLNMLKRKRDALEIKLNDLIAQRKANVSNCNELFREAIFSFAKANFLETDFKPVPIIGSDRADAYMRMTYTKTIGLTLPTFQPVLRKPESLLLTGLSRGGKQVDIIRDKFQELLKVLILMASLDCSIKLVKESLRSTNTRLNGLEYVIIPRLINTSAYISNELDEMEREEFYRLKRSQQKQRERKEKAKKAELKAKKGDQEEGEEGEEGGDEEETEDSDYNETYVDASTSIDFNSFALPIFTKRTAASTAQTVITGHYPDSNEVISPTDSVLSGSVPIIAKISKYKVGSYYPRSKQNIPEIEPPLNNEADKAASSTAQTVITGQFPDSNKFIFPTDAVFSGSIPLVAKRSSNEVSPSGVNSKQGIPESKAVINKESEEQAPFDEKPRTSNNPNVNSDADEEQKRNG